MFRPNVGLLDCFLSILMLLLIQTPQHLNADTAPSKLDQSGYPAPGVGCLAANCHGGIEPIRAHDSRMAKEIYSRGAEQGDPNGCIVCHGGNPKEEKNAEKAHSGAPPESNLNTFVVHSGSVWVNEKTCGQCHTEWTFSQHRSLMQTEAGKIQGALWGWGPASTGYAKKYGNCDISDPDGPVPVFGTQGYKTYTLSLMKKFPDNFPTELKQVPKTNTETLKEKPWDAIYTYLRTDCQRCHVGVKGRNKRGDYR